MAVWTPLDGVSRQYWPGGENVKQTCACGITRSCDVPGYRCNCDIMDGKRRVDYGRLINKAELPVMSTTLLDLSIRDQKVKLGCLQCAPKAFGRIKFYLSYLFQLSFEGLLTRF